MMQDQGDMDIVDERSVSRSNDMEDTRSQTLKSLESFMQAQRALFQRTQADIERLRELKKRADMDPISTLESFLKRPSTSTTYNESSESTSENGFLASLNFPTLQDLGAEVRKYNKDSILHAIDWRLFSGQDPTKLQEMTFSIRKAHPTSVYPTPLPPPRPPFHIPDHDSVSSIDITYPPPLTDCHSKESDLQRLVRIQRKLIVEPALESSANFLASFPDSDSEPCPESAVSAGRGKLGAMRNGRKSKNKAREQNKANARRRRSGASNAGCISIVRQRGPGGIFVKKDTEEVIDIDVVDGTSQLSSLPPPTPSTLSLSRPQRRNVCSTLTSMDIDSTFVDPASIAVSKPSRTRRPSMRIRDGYGVPLDIASETNTDMVVESPSNASIPPTPSNAVFQEPRPIIKLKIRLPPRRPIDFDKNKSHDESAEVREGGSSRSVSQSTRSASRSISTPVDVSGPDDDDDDDDDDEGEDEVTAEEDDISEDEVESKISHAHGNGGDKNQKAKTGRNGGSKPKPATFNVPWTVEEQHHLEQLLKEIPDGEHRRWAKISGRMEGRRTPRQVASRVQKYNLKLKKFGLDLG